MKIIIAMLFTIGSIQLATAQNEHLIKKQKRNEIGLTAEINAFSNINNSTAFQAIQYKHWQNEHFGMRFLLGKRDYYSDVSFSTSYRIDGDTLTKTNYATDATIAIAGVGFEAQRQFYKKVYLFATVETKFGFGEGYIDSFPTRTVYNDTFPWGRTVTTKFSYSAATYNIFYASVTPTFGAKLQFNHICFGTEMSLYLLSYTSMKNQSRPYESMLEFDISTINPRFFVHYRF